VRVSGKGGEPPDDSEELSSSTSKSTPTPQGSPTSPYPKELRDQFRLVNPKDSGSGFDKESQDLMMQALRALMNPEIPLPEPKERPKTHQEQPETRHKQPMEPLRHSSLPKGDQPHLEKGEPKERPKTHQEQPETRHKQPMEPLRHSSLPKGDQPHLEKGEPIESEERPRVGRGVKLEREQKSSVPGKDEHEHELTGGALTKRDAAEGIAAAAQMAAGAQIALGGAGLSDLGSESVEKMTGSQMGSQIDKIIRAFQENQFYSASLSSVQLGMSGTGETRVTVSLTNGIEVELDLAGGGKELNVKIRGLTPDQQARLDRPEEHARLREALQAKGFTVHQISTERGEQLTPQGRQEIPQNLGSLFGGREEEPRSHERERDQEEKEGEPKPSEEGEE
jgi:hypothetical protein